MPFQSEKQRRYMHANLPDIAKRWERDYSNGGIAELNAELNSLPEYYLPYPAAQGGRIGFDSGSNGITLGSDKYNITFEPGASGSLSSLDLGEGYNVDEKNIDYGVNTTANIGPVEIGMDYRKFLDKYNVTEDGKTVEKDTTRDRDIAYMLGLNLEDFYAKIDSDRDFKNLYLTLRYEFKGGGTPAHEAGIYGLADGGQLVQPGPGRPGYNGQGDYTPDRSSDRGPRDDPDRFGPTTETKTTTTGDGSTDRIVDIAERNRRQDLRDIITRGEEEKYDNPLDKWNPETTQGTIKRRTFLEKQALDNWNAVKDTANTWAKKKAGKAVFDHFLLGGATFGLSDVIGGLVQGFKTNKAKQEFIDVIKGSIAEYQKLGFAEHSPHKDTLIQDLNQQLLDLTQTRDRPDEDTGGDGITEVASIKYENIEGVNEDQAERASTEANTILQDVRNAKRDAYLAAFRQKYLMGPTAMAAGGGRVPGGYNTGGLSNLFRLKNV